MAGRRLATAALAGGLGLAALSALRGPAVSRPLYDGVVVAEPYKWLSPPPGLRGGAIGGTDHESLSTVEFAAVTPEVPPQAQAIVDVGALSLPPGTTSITTTVNPVAPPSNSPADGVIAGNVYDIEAVNQRGESVSVAAGQRVTMLFRGPSALPTARIERYGDGVWSAVETDPAGIPDMYTTLVGAFGMYALVAPPGWQPVGVRATPTPTASPSAATMSPGASLPVSPGIAATAASAAISFAPTQTTVPATPQASGGSSSGGSSPGPLVAVLVVLAVVAAAAVVLLRPFKPPSE